MLTRDEILEHAKSIARSYRGQGLTLTLRQLYYQFVARGLLPSGQNVYKRIGDVLTEARYDGKFPIDWIEDRGREVGHSRSTRAATHPDNLDEAVTIARNLPSFLVQRAPWFGQPVYVSVWVEKEALAGVFEDPCGELGVGLFACKGYPSVSALNDWLKAAYFACRRIEQSKSFTYGSGFDWSERHIGHAKRCVVLYFGDHDPDGWEIPRSAERNLRRLMKTTERTVELEFIRCALNMDQIAEYNPPPFDAKETSARFQGYREEHATTDAWELDALDPIVLQDLIRKHVAEHYDESIAASYVDMDEVSRAELERRLVARLQEES